MRRDMWRQYILGKDLEAKEQIFRIILLVGTLVSSVVIIEGLLTDSTGGVTLPLFGLMLVMVSALLLTFKYQKIKVAAVIMGTYLICVMFPLVFFMSGGIESGSMVWLVMGILYVFLMFSGKLLVFYSILAALEYIALYGIGYHYPQYIIPMASTAAVYVDSLFAVLVVGFSVGAIMKFQVEVFEKERQKALEQQKRVEEVSHYREAFFANMSHEIRTPINTIVGLNELILRDDISEEVAEHAVNIQNASKMLLSLINDILDLSKLENQKMSLVPTKYETQKLFLDVVHLMQVQAQKKKLEFYVDIDSKIPTALYGDVKRIRQVLINLLTNAIKYTRKGSVTLAVGIDQIYRETIMLRISVTDTGIGIKKEDLDNLYDSFQRVDEERNAKVEGSGLGLSIVKQLVELMNGEITVDSIYTKGSVFTVVFEQKISDAAPIGNVAFLASASNRYRSAYHQTFEAPEARILIVDDDAMNLMVVSRLLLPTKLQIDTARGGKECLEMTLNKYYDIILLDYMMPEMDGIETLRAIRKQENGLCRDTSIIALTAASEVESEQRYEVAGFDGYVAKPIDAMLLEAEILRFLPSDVVEYRVDAVTEEDDDNIQILSGHKRKKIYIATDCVCDLPREMIEQFDIRLIYLSIQTDQGIFRDTKEIEINHLSRYLTDSSCAATAIAASVEEYEAFFAEMVSQAEEVIYISLARHVGNTYDNAMMAARGFGHVHVVDAGHISSGQGIMVLKAAQMERDGKSVREITQELERLRKKIDTTFLLPSVQVFYQNGYTKKRIRNVFHFLQLHPVLRMYQSRLFLCGAELGKLERSWRRHIQLRMFHKKKIDNSIVYITHAGCSVKQQELILREVNKHIKFEHIIMQKASVTSCTKSGLRTVSIAFVTK